MYAGNTLNEQGDSLDRVSFAARTISIVVIAVALTVIVGWVTGVETLQTVLPGLASMKFNTALSFVLVGAALFYIQPTGHAGRKRRIAWLLSLLLLLLAGLTLVEDVFDFSLGIDEAVIRDPVSAASSWPGRMSPGTSSGFILIAVALLTIDVEIGSGWRPAQVLSLIVTGLGGVALLGYLFDVRSLYDFGPFSSMALHTALLLTLTGLGVLLARPGAGLMAAISSRNVGGRLARFLLPAVVIVPMLLGWLFLEGAQAGFYTMQFGYAFTSLSSIVILAAMVWFGAKSLNAIQARLERHSGRSARLAAIVSSSDDAIIGTDLQGIVTSWNDAAERLYGFAAGEIVGRPITLIVPDERLEEEQEIFRQLRQKRRIDHLETVRLRKDGQRIELSINASPIRDDAGNLVGVSKIARDISQRKRNEAMFRATVEASPIGMIMTDLAGSVVLANAEAEKAFGYQDGELRGVQVDSLVPERFRARHATNRDQFVSEPESRRMGAGRDLFARRKDGREFPVEIGLSQVRTKDGLFVLSSVVDITERKRDEEALRQRTADLIRSNRDLEQFAYVASHDLQEPLRAVSGCVQLLQKRYQGRLDERADEFITHTVDGVQRMQTLIEDLLKYSRVGRMEDAAESSDCNGILETALSNLGAMIREAGAEVVRGDLPTIQAIPSELTLLFQNLLGNALKFRRKDVVPRIVVAAEAHAGEWRFSVEDNGIGIEAQYFGRIFDIFQRLHTRREYPGTGIGLPLCKRIVEKHGGRIWVESELGSGTTVFFTLPDERLSAASRSSLERQNEQRISH